MNLRKALFVFLTIVPYVGLCFDSQRLLFKEAFDTVQLCINIFILYPAIAWVLSNIIYLVIKE